MESELKMVLPLIVFEILIVVAIALFIFGASRESMNVGFIFLLLSAVFFIITGLFLWDGGLQLNSVSDFPINPDGSTSITYEVISSSNGSPVWAISNLFVYGGIALILLSFILTVRQRRQSAHEAQAAYNNY